MRRHFRDGRRARSHNRLSRGHGLQQDDAKAFLHAGQAENVRPIVFRRELRTGHVAQPADSVPGKQLARQAPQRRGVGAIAHQAHRQAGNAPAQDGGRAQQRSHALPPVQAAREKHGEARAPGWVQVQEAPPFRQVDRLGNHRRRLREAVQLACAIGRVGEVLKWDPVAERFTNCEESNRMLSRERRKGYELPG